MAMAMPGRVRRELSRMRVFVRHRRANARVFSDVRLKTRGDADAALRVIERFRSRSKASPLP
jgi:hypothetical protein